MLTAKHQSQWGTKHKFQNYKHLKKFSAYKNIVINALISAFRLGYPKCISSDVLRDSGELSFVSDTP